MTQVPSAGGSNEMSKLSSMRRTLDVDVKRIPFDSRFVTLQALAGNTERDTHTWPSRTGSVLTACTPSLSTDSPILYDSAMRLIRASFWKMVMTFWASLKMSISTSNISV